MICMIKHNVSYIFFGGERESRQIKGNNLSNVKPQLDLLYHLLKNIDTNFTINTKHKSLLKVHHVLKE